jgi:hypothetical protein
MKNALIACHFLVQISLMSNAFPVKTIENDVYIQMKRDSIKSLILMTVKYKSNFSKVQNLKTFLKFQKLILKFEIFTEEFSLFS